MKNEERRRQTVRQLLDATIQLLREKSCGAITMKDMMERSGLSKGAIFHYVKSKDEIFAWVLQERLEEVNDRFNREVEQSLGATFDDPMRVIADNLERLEDAREETNRILVYLLGKEDDPAVAEALRQFYERSVRLSRQWIATGQRHGVIRSSVDPDATAELFVLLTFGLRVRSSFLPSSAAAVTARELAAFMAVTLKQ